MNATKLITLTIVACVLSACGGGYSPTSSGGNNPHSQPASTPGGIWTGTDSVTGLQVTVLVGEDAQFDAIRSDGAQFYGTVTYGSGNLTAQIVGIPEYGTTFADGSKHGAGTVSGTYSAQSQMSVTVSFKTDSGTSTTSTLSLTFNSAYLTTPNVANLAGNYVLPSGVIVTINSDGTLFAQDPTSGCVVNGTINAVTGKYSLYAPLVTYESCVGSDAPLDNLQFDGLMAQTGSTIIAGLHDKSGNNYGLVYTLTKD